MKGSREKEMLQENEAEINSSQSILVKRLGTRLQQAHIIASKQSTLPRDLGEFYGCNSAEVLCGWRRSKAGNMYKRFPDTPHDHSPGITYVVLKCRWDNETMYIMEIMDSGFVHYHEERFQSEDQAIKYVEAIEKLARVA
jgi:hypothetical protein